MKFASIRFAAESRPYVDPASFVDNLVSTVFNSSCAFRHVEPKPVLAGRSGLTSYLTQTILDFAVELEVHVSCGSGSLQSKLHREAALGDHGLAKRAVDPLRESFEQQ